MLLDVLTMVLTIGIIFIGLPWLVLHYLARMRRLPPPTPESGATLNELSGLAKRLEERLQVIERIVAAEEKQIENGASPLTGIPVAPPSDEKKP